jgi:hypothetical protein
VDDKNPILESDYWLKRAEETRAKAKSFAYRPSKDSLLKNAEEYERLAGRAEKWQVVLFNAVWWRWRIH